MSKGNIDDVSRRFLDNYRELLRIDPATLTLKQANAQPEGAGKWWYIEYSQRYEDIPVYRGTVGFTLNPSGDVVSFGADVHPNIELSTTPSISQERAISIAERQFLEEPSDSLAIRNDVSLLVYPDIKDTVAYHLVYHIELLGFRPSKGQGYFVDAHTGQIVRQMDLFRHGTLNVNGTLKGQYWPELPNVSQTTEVIQELNSPTQITLNVWNLLGQWITSGSVATNATYSLTWNGAVGNYIIKNPQSKGKWVKITNTSDKSSLVGVTSSTAYDITYTPSSDGYNAYHHGNVIHNFIKGAPFYYSGMDYQMEI